MKTYCCAVWFVLQCFCYHLQGFCSNRSHLDGSMCHFKTCYTFQYDGAYTDVQVANSIDTSTLPYQTMQHTECWWYAGLSLFSLVWRMLSMISKKKFKISVYLTTEEFSTLPQSIFKMAQWTVFTVSGFWKCFWVHAGISITESFVFNATSCINFWHLALNWIFWQ